MRAGRLRGIAITSLQRSAHAPDIPTAHESGLPNFDVNAWFGMWVPAAVPKPVLAKLYDVVSKTMNHSEVRTAIEKFGYKIGGETPDEFQKFAVKLLTGAGALGLHSLRIKPWLSQVTRQ